jgi:hypothetical protein
MFRSQSKSKSLKVQRETVRVLSGSQLVSAQGGGFGIGRQVGFDLSERIACPLPPQIDTSNDISMSAGGCGPQIPGPSIIVNPWP